MSSDRGIEEWLTDLGYGLPDARAHARAALEEAGLTRAGKQRISEEKLPKAEEALHARFARHCSDAECVAAARRSGLEPVLTDRKNRCDHCGGSNNKRAQADLVAACRRAGVKRIVIVGGSPSVREELVALDGAGLELRLVDGTERRTAEKAKADLVWADLILLWGASELHHKVSTLYSGAPPPLKRKIIHVAKRGIAALLSEAIAHLARMPAVG